MRKLRSDIARILDQIPIDFGGGSSLRKGHAMAWLIKKHALRTTLDIGVYRGRSLFPQAFAHRHFTGGMVYGVDPWSASEAMEHDNAQLKEAIGTFVSNTDFEGLYEQVIALRRTLGLERHCTLLRSTSANAASIFEKDGVSFDLIHIDGNHDTKAVLKDVDLYLPRLSQGGFLVMDDVSWDSVKPAYERVNQKLCRVYELIKQPSDDFAVFWNGKSRVRQFLLSAALHLI